MSVTICLSVCKCIYASLHNMFTYYKCIPKYCVFTVLLLVVVVRTTTVPKQSVVHIIYDEISCMMGRLEKSSGF